jgi:hypothetical protein
MVGVPLDEPGQHRGAKVLVQRLRYLLSIRSSDLGITRTLRKLRLGHYPKLSK